MRAQTEPGNHSAKHGVNCGMSKGESQRQAATGTQTRQQQRPEQKQPWLWNVVLLNDDDHTYDYVIHMMQSLFAMQRERAFQVAESVDKSGRAVCITTHREHAELKAEQIMGFGRDPALATCKGSMSAIIEPAAGEGDGDKNGSKGDKS